MAIRRPLQLAFTSRAAIRGRPASTKLLKYMENLSNIADGRLAPRNGVGAARSRLLLVAPLAAAMALAGCAAAGASGPSTRQVVRTSDQAIAGAGIKVIDVNDAVSQQVWNQSRPALFSEVLGEGQARTPELGPGDIIDISIIEAPPAVLFTGAYGGALSSERGTTVRSTTVSSGLELPQQQIDLSGRITVPFAGSIQAAGRTPQAIEREIIARLRGKAHDPQVVVRRVSNATATVSVLGDVAQSGRVSLTGKGERLLEIIAAAVARLNQVEERRPDHAPRRRQRCRFRRLLLTGARTSFFSRTTSHGLLSALQLHRARRGPVKLGGSLEGTVVSLSQALGELAALPTIGPT